MIYCSITAVRAGVAVNNIKWFAIITQAHCHGGAQTVKHTPVTHCSQCWTSCFCLTNHHVNEQNKYRWGSLHPNNFSYETYCFVNDECIVMCFFFYVGPPIAATRMMYVSEMAEYIQNVIISEGCFVKVMHSNRKYNMGDKGLKVHHVLLSPSSAVLLKHD